MSADSLIKVAEGKIPIRNTYCCINDWLGLKPNHSSKCKDKAILTNYDYGKEY